MSEYRIRQDGMTVAQSNSLTEIIHYAIQYTKDGPIDFQFKESGQRKWINGDLEIKFETNPATGEQVETDEEAQEGASM